MLSPPAPQIVIHVKLPVLIFSNIILIKVSTISHLSSFSAALPLSLLHLVLEVVVVVVDYDDDDYALFHLVLCHQLPQSLGVFSLNITPVFQVPASGQALAKYPLNVRDQPDFVQFLADGQKFSTDFHRSISQILAPIIAIFLINFWIQMTCSV